MLVSARVDHHEFLISNQKTHSIYHTSLCENAHVSPKTSWFFSIHCHGHLERRIKRHDLHHQKSKGDPPPPNARFTGLPQEIVALISGWLEDDGWLHNPLNTRPLCLFLGILPSMPWGGWWGTGRQGTTNSNEASGSPQTAQHQLVGL